MAFFNFGIPILFNRNFTIMQKHILSALILFIFATALFAQDKRDKLIAPNVAVFYPADFDSAANLPSFALLKEFEAIGEIPANWDIRPVYYHSGTHTCASIKVAQQTSLYGTGEVTGPLLRNGKEIELWNTDNYKYLKDNGTRLYQSHPWVLGVNADGTAFGVLADNTWKQKLSLKDSIKFISEGPAFRIIVIKGNTPQEVLKSLVGIIGTMPMPPLWALGYQQCRFSYDTDSAIRSIANGFRSRNIPCDVIWMDIDYMDSFKIFTFNKAKIPNPSELNQYLHSKNIKSVWMIDPGVKKEKAYSVYESGCAGNHWVKDSSGNAFTGKVWPGPCVFPDFTRPETRKWWSGLYADYMATGIDGVWNDMNEPSVFNGPDGTMPENNFHCGGGGLPPAIHLRYHNVYGMLMVKASREGILAVNPTHRPFILSRSGYLGSHRYGATWTGDNQALMSHLKLSIPMVINLGLSGQAFSGPDIGGFAGDASPELFGQWVALGAFYPFSRGHASTETNRKEPWAFGKEVEDVSRTALNRRYRLMPYLYTAFRNASVNGTPVMQPVFFADITDTSLRHEEQSFLLGDNLLITPKWAINPVTPKGNWRLVSIAGENSLQDKFQPDVRIKEGSIIPIGKQIQSTSEYNLDSLTLFISLDKNGEACGTLYEDAGDGFGYQQDEYAIWNFTAIKEDNKIKVEIKKQEGILPEKNRFYKVRIINNNGTFESKWENKTKIWVPCYEQK